MKIPAIISSIILIPFLILEFVNRGGFHADFPIVLFGLMWILPFAFTALLTPTIRGPMTGERAVHGSAGILSRIVLVALLATVWVAIVVDQMPCFVGVPNCD